MSEAGLGPQHQPLDEVYTRWLELDGGWFWAEGGVRDVDWGSGGGWFEAGLSPQQQPPDEVLTGLL